MKRICLWMLAAVVGASISGCGDPPTTEVTAPQFDSGKVQTIQPQKVAKAKMG